MLTPHTQNLHTSYAYAAIAYVQKSRIILIIEQREMEMANQLEQQLCQEYQEWCRSNHLPAMSADELLHEDLTPAQRQYVSEFINRWEAMENDR